MEQHPATPSARLPPEVSDRAIRRGRLLLGALVLGCAVVEAVLLGADWQLWGSPRWRALAVQYGGFWAGLLRDWQPNYAAQPVTMFASYSILHAGPGHLLGNMVVLARLGDLAVARLGARGLALLYGLSAIGGALAFAVLAPSPAPMVGASGAIFGLAGAWTVWDWQDRPRGTLNPWVVSLGIVLGLALLNAAMWWLQDGQLAWQAHLGGFVTGATYATAFRACSRLANSRS